MNMSITRFFQSVLLIATLSLPLHVSAGARWYSADQVHTGKILFQANCSVCHGEKAQGTFAWKRRDAQGNLPPPPLNGSAHAWHHSMSVLERTVQRGGVPLGGVMPGFVKVLDASQIRAVIAFFQSYWSDDIYRAWLARGGLR